MSGILSHSPHWPTHFPRIDDPHLDLIKHRDSPNDAEAEGGKQCNAAYVARTDARHERLRPNAEGVTRVGQEKRESRVCATLSTICGLSYHHLTLDLKVRIVTLVLEKKVHVPDHGQCLDVVVCE